MALVAYLRPELKFDGVEAAGGADAGRRRRGARAAGRAGDAVRIETERLILRPLAARRPRGLRGDERRPGVMDFPRPLTRAESDAEIADFEARWGADGFCFAAIERRSDGALARHGRDRALRHCDAPICPCVEIGWRLPHAALGAGLRQRGGAGLARPRLRGARARGDRRLHRSPTSRSLAVMRRIGMRRDPARDFEHPAMPAGHPLRPHVVFAIGGRRQEPRRRFR